MTSVAVVAHRKKLGESGLKELRRVLAAHGVDRPAWYEVGKSRQAGPRAEQALKDGADLVFACGGDGTVQRCVDALATSDAALAIVPAGTANLLASNLGVPKELEPAVATGLYGTRKRIDVGTLNGERFAVMAGAGFDAQMTGDADSRWKRRVGQLAYVWSGTRAARQPAWPVRVRVDGTKWFKGEASCILVGNVGTLSGGLTAFPDARPDDGRLDVAVVTADGMLQWARVLSRVVVGRAERSPLVQTTTATELDVRFDSKVPYELDGGDRPGATRLRVAIEPAAIQVCVPPQTKETAS